MTRKTFQKILDNIRNHNNKVSELYKYNVDLIEFDNELQTVISLLFKEILNEFQIDMLEWYLYEKNGDPEMKAWEDNKEILRNDNELYNYLFKK